MNILFVHGAWHSAAHWNKVAEKLTEQGHLVHAMDLPGSGLDADYPQSYLANDFDAFASEASPVGSIHLSDYSDAIVAQVRELAPQGKVTLALVFGAYLAVLGIVLLLSAAVTPRGMTVQA